MGGLGKVKADWAKANEWLCLPGRGIGFDLIPAEVVEGFKQQKELESILGIGW
jgi:hypothetical protein